MGTRPAAILLVVALALTPVVVTGCDKADTGTKSETPAANEGLAVGTAAPDFRMKDQEQVTVALSDYKGEKNVILVFYPADFTPV